MANLASARCGLSKRELFRFLVLISRLSSSENGLLLESLEHQPVVAGIIARQRRSDEVLPRLVRCLSGDGSDGPPLLRTSEEKGDLRVMGLTDAGLLLLSDLRSDTAQVYQKRASEEVKVKQVFECLKALNDAYEGARLLLRPGPIARSELRRYFSAQQIDLMFNPVGQDVILLYRRKTSSFTHKFRNGTDRLIVTCSWCNAPMQWGLSGGSLHCHRCNYTGVAGQFSEVSRRRHKWLHCPNCGGTERLHHKGKVGITSAFQCSNEHCRNSYWDPEEALVNSFPVETRKGLYLCKDFVYRFFALPNEFENLLYSFRRKQGFQWAQRYPQSDLVDWAILDNDGVLEIADAKRWKRTDLMTEAVLESFQAKSVRVRDEISKEGIEGRATRRMLIVLQLPERRVCDAARDMGIHITTAHSYLQGFLG